jgi:hypothetical protein
MKGLTLRLADARGPWNNEDKSKENADFHDLKINQMTGVIYKITKISQMSIRVELDSWFNWKKISSFESMLFNLSTLTFWIFLILDFNCSKFCIKCCFPIDWLLELCLLQWSPPLFTLHSIIEQEKFVIWNSDLKYRTYFRRDLV